MLHARDVPDPLPAALLSDWEQAFVDNNVTNGTGSSEDDCIVVGAREGGAVEYLTNNMALSDDVDGQGMLLIQEQIRADLKLKWRGTYGRVYLWQRLHPWAIDNFVNQFTYNTIGCKGLAKNNAILKGASKKLGDGLSRADADTADTLSRDEDN